jgi:predicted amidophosphoribosyltransferase
MEQPINPPEYHECPECGEETEREGRACKQCIAEYHADFKD